MAAAKRYRFRIRELFAEKGLTNGYQVQKATGKPPASAARLIDEDRDRIGLETINELCEFLDCTPGDLFVADKAPRKPRK